MDQEAKRKRSELSMNPQIERDREMIIEARKKGKGALTGAFVRLSGPGWLQSAITLGGGSLSSSMYLGILGGFAFLWLQPLAMVAGIIMLSAISYVTLSTDETPLKAINRHVNPVLGWGWLLASMTANIVWSIPQYSLGIASLRQNLFEGLLGENGALGGAGLYVAALIVLCIAMSASMLYSIGGKGAKTFDILVKCLVGTTVLCFVAVVVRLLMTGQIQFREIANGFMFHTKLLTEPVKAFADQIAQVAPAYQDFWASMIVGQQRDVMISAGATAVGINMTFLLPYSMLRKGWDREFRGLAIFDLSTGLFFPFLIATSCVVIAAASQFHGVAAPGLLGETDAQGTPIQPAGNLVGPYDELLADRVKAEVGAEAYAAFSPEELQAKKAALPEADRTVAAMIVRRDAFNLAAALAPITGDKFARYVFGLGVMGMATGAATMLTLINGLCFCALLDVPARGWQQRVGMFMPAIAIVVPLFWKGAFMWLAVPTSVFCMTLLPFAYISFFLLMNQRKYLGADTPMGAKRLLWNVLMVFSCLLACVGAFWSIYSKQGGLKTALLIGGFAILLAIGHFLRKSWYPETEA
ncbi:MAG TPA: divalent metal cation transporter [Candidatus Hydrogenedentes bacterium]|nr:divalent metal cation transporter [Candidatus Hydrogenedentota bacterium]